jgi:hypothetical protein
MIKCYGAAARLSATADPPGALEVGEHEDVEQLGAGSGTERFQVARSRRSSL